MLGRARVDRACPLFCYLLYYLISFSYCSISLLHAGLGKPHICLSQPLKVLRIYKHCALWRNHIPFRGSSKSTPAGGSGDSEVRYCIQFTLSLDLDGVCEPRRLGALGPGCRMLAEPCFLWLLPRQQQEGGSSSYPPTRCQPRGAEEV